MSLQTLCARAPVWNPLMSKESKQSPKRQMLPSVTRVIIQPFRTKARRQVPDPGVRQRGICTRKQKRTKTTTTTIFGLLLPPVLEEKLLLVLTFRPWQVYLFLYSSSVVNNSCMAYGMCNFLAASVLCLLPGAPRVVNMNGGGKPCM